MANQLVQVQTYNQNFTLPQLRAHLTFADLAEKHFENWDSYISTAGGKNQARGDTLKYRLPTQFNVDQTLGFNPTSPSTGNFTERYGYLIADQFAQVVHAMTDQQLATYPLDELQQDMSSEKMAAIAGDVDRRLAQNVCFGGYRWVGDVKAGPTSNLTFPDLRRNVSLARNFGGGEMLEVVLSDTATTQIANTGFQEFTPSRNDEMVKDWELGMVKGIAKARFYQSNLLPVHTAGTAQADSAAAASGGLTMTAVVSTTYTTPGTTNTVGATNISLSGLTPGATVLVNDIGDIGSKAGLVGSSAFNAVNPIKFLRQQDHTLTEINPQFKVVVGGVADGSGNLTITVIPDFIYDGTNTNPARNLNRAIDLANDRLRLVASHRAGVIFFKKGFMFASPKLSGTSPYVSSSVMDESGISLRSYYGYVFGYNTTMMVNDLYFGATTDSNYACRVIFPVESGSVY